MIQNTFNIAGGVARNPLVRLATPITATISAGEHIAIVGPNGGGKSLFVDTLIGKYPLREGVLQYDFSPSATQTVYDNVKYIAFRDTYGAADADYYYHGGKPCAQGTAFPVSTIYSGRTVYRSTGSNGGH